MNAIPGALTAPGHNARAGVVCRVSALMVASCADQSSEQMIASLESIFCQTVLPEQLILVVCDPISTVQEAVIELYRSDSRIPLIDIIRLPKQGRAAALGAGLEACLGEWVMCVDHDHVSRPDRLAIQLSYAETSPDTDLFASWLEERSVHGQSRVRASPVEHSAVVNALRWRNIIPYSSCLVRTTTLRAFGYRSQYDQFGNYELFIRMAAAGARFRVIPAALVSIQKRHHRRCKLEEIRFRYYCLRVGFLTLRQFMVITAASLVFGGQP
ncbi:MAG TPA: glycosyltransferase [Acetobacteraceae bacterium]